MPGCQGCPMAAKFPDNTFVAPEIAPGSCRIAVAEAPGAEEQAQGKPLVGGAGKVAQGLYAKAGVEWKHLSKINCIQCRPPDNVFPRSREARAYISAEDAEVAISQCQRNHVRPVLEAQNWDRVDLLGQHALNIVGGRSGSISQWRGSILSLQDTLGRRTPIFSIPTYHPAYLMRDQTMLPVAASDLRKSTVLPPEEYDVYPSLETVARFDATTFALDIENNPVTGEVYMVGLSDRLFRAICVPYKGPYVAELARILRSASTIIGHNHIQHDLPLLERAGCVTDKEVRLYDTMLMQHLVQPDFPHDLEFVASLFTNKPAWKHLAEENEELYCCRDVDVTFQIWQQLRPLLDHLGLSSVYHNVSVPVAKICHAMRAQGVKIDPGQIKKVRERLLEQSAAEEEFLPAELRSQDKPCNRRVLAPPGSLSPKTGKPIKYQMVPSSEHVVPWRSDKEVGAWLYDTLGLPQQTHVKTGKITTDKTALEKLYRLSHQNRGIRAIRNLRSMDETLTTFAKKDMAFSGTSVHSNFNVHGTSSGRLSSSDPNLQNIPEAARCIYIPRSRDWLLFQADYSSLENRLTAWFAQDWDRLRRMDQPGYSEHKWAAGVFFNLDPADVVKDNDPASPYNKAKHIVHGSNYGMGARKIANMYDMDEREVKGLLTAWKQANPKTTAWQEETAAKAKEQGFLVNPFGRKRWFWTSSYYTESLSFLPQSTGADIVLRAMIGLTQPGSETVLIVEPLLPPAHLILQVHDSLVVEFPATMLGQIAATVKRVMMQPWPELGNLVIPIAAEVGENWGPADKGGSLRKYEIE